MDAVVRHSEWLVPVSSTQALHPAGRSSSRPCDHYSIPCGVLANSSVVNRWLQRTAEGIVTLTLSVVLPWSVSEPPKRPFKKLSCPAHVLLNVGLEMPCAGLPVIGHVTDATGEEDQFV